MRRGGNSLRTNTRQHKHCGLRRVNDFVQALVVITASLAFVSAKPAYIARFQDSRATLATRPSFGLCDLDIIMGLKGTPFEDTKFHKGEAFPPLYRQLKAGGPYSLIPASDGPAWLATATVWLQGKGGRGFIELIKVLGPISSDGTQALPIFPDKPGHKDFTTDVGRLELLVFVSKTAYAQSVNFPDEAALRAGTKENRNKLITGLVNIIDEFGGLINVAARPPGSLLSLAPEILNNVIGASYLDGAPRLFAAAVQFNQIIRRFKNDAQGTAMQLKVNLVTALRKRLRDKTFSIWGILSLADSASMPISNIHNKQPDYTLHAEKEVMMEFSNLVREVARTTASSSRLRKLS
jgi:hypothetical protein